MRFHVLGPLDVRGVADQSIEVTTYGGLRLLGAEFWQPEVGQPTPMLGDEPFNGPMPGHGGDMPVHYDLHVWTHVANPSGVFATWNRNVSC